jgi:hypothetical protein
MAQPPDSPPVFLNLGSNTQDSSITVTCAGKKPYSKLSCTVNSLLVTRKTVADYEKARQELQKDMETQSEKNLQRMQTQSCSNVESANKDLIPKLKTYSPGRAAVARDGYEQLKSLCECKTRECLASVMMAQQTGEQNECTVTSRAFAIDFVKVDDRKWVSNNGPEGVCGVVSVFTMESDAKHSNLWTYTEHYTYTNRNSGLCKGLPSEESTVYSWKAAKPVRLKCEELKLDISPAWQ